MDETDCPVAVNQRQVLLHLDDQIVERLKQYSETGKPVPYFAFATR